MLFYKERRLNTHYWIDLFNEQYTTINKGFKYSKTMYVTFHFIIIS
jgi:hypothetical protein